MNYGGGPTTGRRGPDTYRITEISSSATSETRRNTIDETSAARSPKGTRNSSIRTASRTTAPAVINDRNPATVDYAPAMTHNSTFSATFGVISKPEAAIAA